MLCAEDVPHVSVLIATFVGGALWSLAEHGGSTPTED